MEERLWSHLKMLGCKSSADISLACQVFMELVDVKLKHDVQLLYNEKLRIPFLTAKNSKNSDPHIFVPCSTLDSVTMKHIEELQNNLCDTEGEKVITLACVEGDSTVVFYTFSRDFVSLQNPEIFIRQKTREERKNYLEKEIKKNRNKLLAEAYKHSGKTNQQNIETIDVTEEN